MKKKLNKVWVILFGGEESFSLLAVLNKEEYQGMICADSGANHAFAFGLIPDIVIGDFDSIDQQVKDYFKAKGVEFISYPEDKDYTDGELAIKEALNRGADKLFIFGAFGGRTDHQLANLFLAGGSSHLFRRIILFGDEFYAIIAQAEEKIIIKGKKGDTVSLLPLSQMIKNITIEGFKYPLVNNDLAYGSTWGLSNVLIVDNGAIYYKEGMLLIIHYQNQESFDLKYLNNV